MPNRYVREDAIESVRLNSVSWLAEVFFRRLINRVDDFGRIEAHPALLRAKVFPLNLDKVCEADVGKLLLECEQAGLVLLYEGQGEHKGKRFLQMCRWEQGRAKTSKHPPPPADICKRMQTSVRTCLQIPTDVPDSDSDSDTDYGTDNGGCGGVKRPSLEQARERAPTLGVRPDDAETWWHSREASDWMRSTSGGGGAVPVGKNWASDMKMFTANRKEGLKRNGAGRPEPVAKGVDKPKNEKVLDLSQ